MASEAVNAVLSAEKSNDEKVAAANEKAKSIISDASERAAAVVEKCIADAKAKAQKITADADAKAAEIISGGEEADKASGAMDIDKSLYTAAVAAVKEKALATK